MTGGSNFNPLHPRRRRRWKTAQCGMEGDISIHSTREGGDDINMPFHLPILFQSTPPAKAETTARQDRIRSFTISIHSTREGGDVPSSVRYHTDQHFNPLHPRRRRPQSFVQRTGVHLFQSTPPAKAETQTMKLTQGGLEFQSTPPAKAETISVPGLISYKPDFNPLHPRRRRRCIYPIC